MNDPLQLKDIAEVCSTCYESVNAAGQDRCSHTKVIMIYITKHTVHSDDHFRDLCASRHLQECCVVGENGEVESVRPKPTSDMILNIHSYTGRRFNGNYKLCRNYPPCESRCTFAHGNLELLAWNGGSSCSLSYWLMLWTLWNAQVVICRLTPVSTVLEADIPMFLLCTHHWAFFTVHCSNSCRCILCPITSACEFLESHACMSDSHESHE